MTNTPGWASPGSSDSSEPENGDSPSPPAVPPAAAAEKKEEGAAAAPEAQQPPAAGTTEGWSQQQPPPGPWHTPSASGSSGSPRPTGPAGAPAAPDGTPTGTSPDDAGSAAAGSGGAPRPPVPGQSRPADGGWGQQWAPPSRPEQQNAGPQTSGPRWGPAAPQQGGWPPAWGSTPAAPQPGVIPLRPLDVGEILQGAFSTLRLHWRTILPLTFVVAVVVETVNVLIQGFLVDDTRIDDLRHESDPSFSDLAHALSGSLAGSALALLITVVGVSLTSALLTLVTSRAVLGRPASLSATWREGRPRLLNIAGLTLLVPLTLAGIVAAGALPGLLIALAGGGDGGTALASLGILIAMVVAVWRWNQWSLSAPALMLERQGIVPAMKRSAKLVQGTWWRVLGVQLLVMIIAGLASSFIQLPFALIGDAVSGDGVGSFFSNSNPSWTALIITGVGGVLGSTVTLPISAGAVSLLYMDQRIRREALDVELARAAKVPGYETPTNSGVTSAR